MSYSERDLLFVLREEYDSRLKSYLSEIEVKDSNDNDLIANAVGLKVKDAAGYMYTVGGVLNDESGNVIVRLLLPDESAAESSVLNVVKEEASIDDDHEEVKDDSYSEEDEDAVGVGSDLMPRNKDAAFKRSFNVSIDKEPYWNSVNSNIGEEGIKYIDIPIEEFAERFTL